MLRIFFRTIKLDARLGVYSKNDVAEPNLFNEGNHQIAESYEIRNIGFKERVCFEIVGQSGNNDPQELQSSTDLRLRTSNCEKRR